MRNPVWPSSCATPAGTSNELDVQNEWEENAVFFYLNTPFFYIIAKDYRRTTVCVLLTLTDRASAMLRLRSTHGWQSGPTWSAGQDNTRGTSRKLQQGHKNINKKYEEKNKRIR